MVSMQKQMLVLICLVLFSLNVFAFTPGVIQDSTQTSILIPTRIQPIGEKILETDLATLDLEKDFSTPTIQGVSLDSRNVNLSFTYPSVQIYLPNKTTTTTGKLGGVIGIDPKPLPVEPVKEYYQTTKTGTVKFNLNYMFSCLRNNLVNPDKCYSQMVGYLKTQMNNTIQQNKQQIVTLKKSLNPTPTPQIDIQKIKTLLNTQ